jgi:hypothetical protein
MTEKSLTYIEFDNKDGDDKYFEWMRKNPNGFVLHPFENRKTHDYIFHKSLCPHIADESPNADGSRMFSYKDEPKVCSTNEQGLIEWFNEQKLPMSKVRPCISCSRRHKGQMPAYLSGN